MMTKILMLTSRSIVIELDTDEKYETQCPYQIKLNDRIITSNRIVETIDGLIPDTAYSMEIFYKDKKEKIDFKTKYESVTLNVRRMNAHGDGEHDDTAAIQAAILSCPVHGRVLIPRGKYSVTALFLKSNITIELEEGATILGNPVREKIPVLPGIIQQYDETDDYNLGTWEGNPLDCFASVLTGICVENVVITGRGTLDGNATEKNWWKDDRAKITAFRPRMVFLNRCKNVTLHGIKIQNSPSWTIHPYFSQNISILCTTLTNPWDSPNTDGIDPESVNGLTVAGVYFSLGDDCIAIKSGKYYMGSTYGVPSEHIEVRHCYMHNGHGAVSIGSENSGGVYHVHVESCIFDHTDRGCRIKTRRGRGKKAVVKDISFHNIDMDNVRTPIVINCFYNCCDPDRHSEYVRSKQALPVDDRTPSVNQLSFTNLDCNNTHACAAFIYGLPENPIDFVELRHVKVRYSDNPVPMEPAMMDDIDENTTLLGGCFYNIHRLELEDVDISGCRNEPFDIQGVAEVKKS